jgi:phage minor structural protein
LQALQAWGQSILEPHPFTFWSSNNTVSTSEWKVPDFENPRQVLAGRRGSILDYWGGEYEFDNYHIRLHTQRGRYSNTLLAYGRNLTNFEQEESILNTYTSIYPVVVLDEKVYTLPELVVDSDYINKYPNRRTLLVDFSDEFELDEPFSESKLRTRAQRYIIENEVGVPKVSMNISTLDFSKMIDKTAPEILDLADTVKVFFTEFDIETEARVMETTWDVLGETYKNYRLGAKKATLSSIVNSSLAEVRAATSSLQQQALNAILGADGKSTNFYGNASAGFPENASGGDLYFQQDGDVSNIFKYINGSWVNLLADVPLDASNITTGTINASNVNITNINAANITTGTLNAARIGANSITSDKLATNAVQVGLASWNSTVRITPTAINFYSGTSLITSLDSSGLNFYGDALLKATMVYTTLTSYGPGPSIRLYESTNIFAITARNTGSTNDTPRLLWSRTAPSWTNVSAGFTFFDRVHFNQPVACGHKDHVLSFTTYALGTGTGVTCPIIRDVSSGNGWGIGFGKDGLYAISATGARTKIA